jgi:hypothetical protein
MKVSSVLLGATVDNKDKTDINANNTNWSFPSFKSCKVQIADDQRICIIGDQLKIDSYLNNFGCVPIFDGHPPSRKLARLNDKHQWFISEPDGTTRLETPVEIIKDSEHQRTLLSKYSWYHIGYLMNSIIEFDFGEDGEGFSRYAYWGYQSKIVTIRDYYWRYSIRDNFLIIEWEDEGDTEIPFILTKELHVAFSKNNGNLGFYDMALRVESPLFPPSADFAQGLLNEYWGKLKVEGSE